MSSLSLIFLILGFIAIVVFFIVKNDKGLHKKLTSHSSGQRKRYSLSFDVIQLWHYTRRYLRVNYESR